MWTSLGALLLVLWALPSLSLSLLAWVDASPAAERTDLAIDWDSAAEHNYNVSTRRLIDTFVSRTQPLPPGYDYTGILDGRFMMSREAYDTKYQHWLWVFLNRGYPSHGIGWNGKVFTRHEALALPFYLGDNMLLNDMSQNARLYLGTVPASVAGDGTLSCLVMAYHNQPWIDYMRQLDDGTLYGLFTSSVDDNVLGGFMLRPPR